MIFNFLVKIFNKVSSEEYIGAVDNRSAAEKARDYSIEEIVTLGETKFPTREPIGYTPRNQANSGSCTAQTVAKMLEAWDYKNDKVITVYSAAPTYASRTNKPKPGMSYTEALGYSVKNGTYLEKDNPSQMMSDEQMTKTVPRNKQSIKPNSFIVSVIDFYKTASLLDLYPSSMIWFKSSYSEWNRDIPEGGSDSEAVRHSVAAVDKITYNDKEYIIIEDSWGTWVNTSDIPLKKGQRAITKEFFDKHCFFVGAYDFFSYGDVDKPKFNFKNKMSYGNRSTEIKYLQDVLKYEKFFPSDKESTGFFGGLTAKALLDWQVSHGILDFINEKDVRKIVAGKKTLAELNRLYS
jgi:hypothetical protein